MAFTHRSIITTALSMLAFCLMTTTLAEAQVRQTGNSFATNNAAAIGSGSNAGGASAFGQSAINSSGGGTQGFGQSGFGQSALGQSGAGQGAFGQQQGLGAAGQTGANQNQFGATAFGAQQASGAGNLSTPNFTAPASNNSVRQRSNNVQRNPSGATGGGTSRPALRPRYAVGFDYRVQPVAAAHTNVTTSITAASRQVPQLAGVQVEMSTDGVVTLSGDVASEDERELAAALSRLEPGVDSVVNDLSVTAPQ